MTREENPKRGGADVRRWRKIDMTNWIWDADLHIVKKVILQGYVRHADKEGVAWPSVATLCKYTNSCERTVRLHRKELIAMGLLEVVENLAGRSLKVRLNTEVLNHPRMAAIVVPTPAVDAPPYEMHPCTTCTTPLQEMPATPAADAPEYIQGTKFKEPIHINVEVQLWEKINDLRKQHLAPGTKPLKLSDGRRRAIRGRVKESSKDDVLSVVKWFLTSSHQRAVYIRMNHSIDTVLRPSNFQSYLEFSQTPEMSPEDKFIAEMEAFEQAEEAQYGDHP